MELTVISGKGGTGKTMVSVALAELFGNAVKADCDVDAPNLYLYYKGQDVKKENFYASHKAFIDLHFCTNCGACEAACRFDAIKNFCVDEINCEGCGACLLACTQKAILLKPNRCADVYLTDTQTGMLSRAIMAVGSDGSGKLITQLRKNARRFLEDDNLMIIDGSPGIGCPVISSVTASDLVLLVVEPTLSGLEDFKRVAELCMRFGITITVCINKCDINSEVANQIKEYCEANGMRVVGEIPYDDTVMQSINELQPITEYPESAAGAAVVQMWEKLRSIVSELRRKKTGEYEEQKT